MRVLLFFAVSLCIGLCACGGGSTAPTTVYGTYTLQTVNGAKPPVVIFTSSSGTISVTGGTLTLRQDGTFEWTRTEHSVYSGGTSDGPNTEDGTFTQTGNDLTLTWTSCCNIYTYAVAWSGNRVTLTDPGQGSGSIAASYVYSR